LKIKRKRETLRILSLDPGSRNFGIAIQKFRKYRNRIQHKIIYTSLFKNTIINLKEGVDKSIDQYLKEIIPLLETTRPNILVIERFASRMLGGTQIELVNIMLSAAIVEARRLGIHTELVMAVVWKNAANRVLPLSLVPKEAMGVYTGNLKKYNAFIKSKKGKKVGRSKFPKPMDYVYSICGATPHEVDAALTGHFYASKYFNLEPFAHLKSKRALKILLQEIEKKSKVEISSRRLSNINKKRR